MNNNTPQRENQTNSLSEEHVQSAIETVLANQVQTYEEFMNAFTALTPADVAHFQTNEVQEWDLAHIEQELIRAGAGARDPEQDLSAGSRDQELIRGEARKLDQEPCQLFELSSQSPRSGASQPRAPKQEEELDVEELGDDFIDDKAKLGGSDTKRTSKHIQVDNYLDEPDSESEFLSADNDDDDSLDFNDSSSKYVASFDTEPNSEGEATKPRTPVMVTPELVERVTEKGELEASQEDADQDLQVPVPDLYPGEVDDEEGVASHSNPSSPRPHITQLPTSNRIPEPSEAVQTTDTQQETTQDNVQPFSIDPDFDYDNVKLTPKWEPGEGPPFGP